MNTLYFPKRRAGGRSLEGRSLGGGKDFWMSIHCFSVNKTELIYTHIDHTCDISIQGGQEEGV